MGLSGRGVIVGIVGLVMVASSPGFVYPGDGIEEVEGRW